MLPDNKKTSESLIAFKCAIDIIYHCVDFYLFINFMAFFSLHFKVDILQILL